MVIILASNAIKAYNIDLIALFRILYNLATLLVRRFYIISFISFIKTL